jgi:hypothetical protein
MNPRLLLILGRNRMAVPAIELLERSGCRTLVLDRDETPPARASWRLAIRRGVYNHAKRPQLGTDLLCIALRGPLASHAIEQRAPAKSICRPTLKILVLHQTASALSRNWAAYAARIIGISFVFVISIRAVSRPPMNMWRYGRAPAAIRSRF